MKQYGRTPGKAKKEEERKKMKAQFRKITEAKLKEGFIFRSAEKKELLKDNHFLTTVGEIEL